MDRLTYILLILTLLAFNSAAEPPTGYSYGITQDQNANIYLATQTGGYRYDGTHYIALNKLFNIPHNWVKDIEFDTQANKLYVALGSDGLYQVDLKTQATAELSSVPCWRIELAEQLINCQNSSQIRSIIKGENALVTNLMNDEVIINAISKGYIDTSEGLFKVDGMSIIVIDDDPSKYSRLSADENGLLAWRDGSLYYYDSHGKVTSVAWKTYPSTIKIDGNTALIAQNGKVMRLSLFDFDVISTSISSFTKVIKYIFKDLKGDLWLLSTNTTEIISKAKKHIASPIPSAYNMMVTDKTTKFIGTEKGVFIKQHNTARLLGDPDEYGYVVTDLKLLGSHLFIATSKGLTKYNLSSGEFESIFKGYVIVLNEINGVIYIGTNDHGLYTHNGNSTESMKDLNAVMRSKEVVAIEYIDNKLYVGTGTGFYTKEPSGAIDSYGEHLKVITGFAKVQSKFYVSTFGQGLYEFNNKQLTRLNTPQSIAGIAVHKKQLIVATISGLYTFDGSARLITGSKKLNITPNSLMTHNQTVTFGTQYGIDSIKLPSNISDLIPKIAGVSINGTFSSQLQTELDASKHNRIFLTLNSFIHRVEFQYNLGNGWQDATQGYVDLLITQPDQYKLNIRVRELGSTWSTPVSFELNMKGTWYQSNLFYYFVFTVITLAISVVLYLLTLYLKANFTVHEKLHKMYSFTNTNNLLAMMTKAKARCSSSDVNVHADGLVYIDEVIDILIPMAHGNAVLGKRSLQQGVSALQASFKYEAPNSELEFVCSTEQGKTLPEAVQRDAYSVIYHSVKNSVEHGKANRIEVFVEQVRGTLQVNIIDNGIGYSWFIRHFNYGLGLFLMRQVARRNHTKLDISSCKKGTSVSMSFNLKVVPDKSSKIEKVSV